MSLFFFFAKKNLTEFVRPFRVQTVNLCGRDGMGWDRPKVLRTLCLELDETSLLLQMSAFRKDPVEAARALGCEGRG